MGDSVYQVDRNLDITDEVVEKLKGRKEKLERRKTRHQQEAGAGNFPGLPALSACTINIKCTI